MPTTVELPDWLIPGDSQINWVKATAGFRSPTSSKFQGIELSGGRWVMSVTFNERAAREAGQIEAFLFDLAGGSNRVRLWHFRTKGEPRGSMRGTPVLHANRARGDKTLVIETLAGKTLAWGDMFNCSGQLFQANADCLADSSGLMTVPLVNRVRASMSAGAAVGWFRPTADFILPTFGGITARPGKVDAATAVFEEIW